MSLVSLVSLGQGGHLRAVLPEQLARVTAQLRLEIVLLVHELGVVRDQARHGRQGRPGHPRTLLHCRGYVQQAKTERVRGRERTRDGEGAIRSYRPLGARKGGRAEETKRRDGEGREVVVIVWRCQPNLSSRVLWQQLSCPWERSSPRTQAGEAGCIACSEGGKAEPTEVPLSNRNAIDMKKKISLKKAFRQIAFFFLKEKVVNKGFRTSALHYQGDRGRCE